MTELEQERFRAAREKALQRTKGAQGIGTLSEKTLHAALKAYYEPDDESREVALGGFVADIVGEEGIIEIQTRGFERLRGKLEAFLEAARVTVVYPVAVERQLRWIDPGTGEVLPPRGSTKKGIPFDVLPELYKIKPLLTHPNFRLRLALLVLTDYKYLDGYGKQRKIRASRGERVPEALHGEIDCACPADYACLLPETLASPFTAVQLAKAVHRPAAQARAGIQVLCALGVLERAGSAGRAYLYRRLL